MSKIGKLTYAQKKSVSLTGLCMQRTGMLRPGDRIGVAVSGGVDSFVLLKTLLIRQAIVPFPFEIMALHVNPGFSPDSHRALARWCAAEGVALHAELTDFGPRAHSPENRKNSPCFYCAMLRRKRLFALCREYGLSHLAFGHNADDLVVTTFMNLLQNGRSEGLSIREDFFEGRLQVVRPALLVEKSFIRAAARQWSLPVWANDCPSNGKTRRDDMLAWLQELWAHDKAFRVNTFNGLTRKQLDLTSP
ncbi:tRNA 2-thiocytidine biosynthesis TtcA family protein [Desulfovibrio aminophilus]|nr:tRNA 2-thiocytidine biosynthesis TtcA family protein [Desulfovibrio aminophilus]MCM0756260.1 tRNA 2-thiocytidine biosynthesis TtcA family protein [Desulfovibrio aminophilus]